MISKKEIYILHGYKGKPYLETGAGGYPGHQDVYFAGMENENSTLEEATFDNIAETRQTDQNYAKTGNNSARLNAAPTTGTATPIGPTKSLMVRPGQRIEIEVYAKYEDLSSSSFTSIGATALASAIGSALGTPSGWEGINVTDHLSDLFGVETWLVGSTDNIPMAYLNYLLFDSDYNFIDAGFAQVSENSEGMSAPHDLLQLGVDIKQDGYIFIYTSNENDEDLNVFFDDFLIRHFASPEILESTDYYPFGSVMRQFTKPDFGGYRFGYQGEFSEEDEETGWNHFELRQYDAKIGRFISADPYRQFASPYIGMGNNPVYFTDPTGGCIGDPNCPDNPSYRQTYQPENTIGYWEYDGTDWVAVSGYSLQEVVVTSNPLLPSGDMPAWMFKKAVVEVEIDAVIRYGKLQYYDRLVYGAKYDVGSIDLINFNGGYKYSTGENHDNDGWHGGFTAGKVNFGGRMETPFGDYSGTVTLDPNTEQIEMSGEGGYKILRVGLVHDKINGTYAIMGIQEDTAGSIGFGPGSNFNIGYELGGFVGLKFTE